MTQPVVFEFNKTLMILALLLVTAVVAGGFALLFLVLFPTMRGLYFFKTVATLIIAAVYGLAGFLTAKQLFSKKPGLVVDANGLTDNSSPFSVGFVPWADVTEISTTTNELKRSLILVKVGKPGDYIARAALRSSNVLRSYLTQFGTPIVISAGSLKEKAGKTFEIMMNAYENRERV